MPSTPLVELIADDLVTTLRGISTASGYHNDVGAVIRRSQFGQRDGDNFVVVAQGESERDFDAPHNNCARWSQSFWVDWYVVEQEGGDAIDTRINKARADVEKIVMVDPNRGGYAIDTIPMGVVLMPDEQGGGIAGVSVVLKVSYQNYLTDPNAQR
jgi:hypothetical protein